MQIETNNPKASPNFPDNLPAGWKVKLSDERDKDYFKKLTAFLSREIKIKKNIFPPRSLVLKALQSVDVDDVKVVILGQDPYHGPGQAMGLSFAVPNSLQPKPPSLMNIFKEIAADLKVEMKGKGSDLTGWAAQGVLLLNTVLTVRASEALSHRNMGWEQFTDRVIEVLNERKDPVIFILWGASAQKKKEIIGTQHFVLESAHPSPLSAHRGFFGCHHFSKVNEILDSLGKSPIDWAETSRSV